MANRVQLRPGFNPAAAEGIGAAGRGLPCGRPLGLRGLAEAYSFNLYQTAVELLLQASGRVHGHVPEDRLHGYGLDFPRFSSSLSSISVVVWIISCIVGHLGYSGWYGKSGLVQSTTSMIRWNLGLRTAWKECVCRTSAYRALSSKFGSAILFLNFSLFLLDTGMRFLGFLAIVLWLLKFIRFLSRSRLNFRPLPFCCPS